MVAPSPRIGPRWDIGGWFWRRLDYWAWATLRTRMLVWMHRVLTTGLGMTYISLVAVMMYSWSELMHRTWSHYAAKERERMYFIQLIEQARDAGQLPPSILPDFRP